MFEKQKQKIKDFAYDHGELIATAVCVGATMVYFGYQIGTMVEGKRFDKGLERCVRTNTPVVGTIGKSKELFLIMPKKIDF